MGRDVFEGKDPVLGLQVRFKILAVSGDLAKVRLLHPLVGRDINTASRCSRFATRP